MAAKGLLGAVVILQLSFRATYNIKKVEGSDKVAITGSDPGLMRMWCTAEEQS